MSKFKIFFRRIRIFFVKPENIFFLLATIFGTIAVFIIPPGWNSDEYQHFYRVEQLSSGGLFARDPVGMKSKGGVAGGYVDTGAMYFIQKNGFENRSELQDRAATPIELFRQDVRYTGEKEYTGFNGSAVYSPVTYIPQVTGNLLNKLMGGPVYLGFLMSRLFGLLSYILLVYFAIKIIPRGKWILVTLALLPTSVVQAGAIGGDAMTFSFVVLFISYVIKLAYSEKRIVARQVLVLTAITAGLGLVKPTYIALVPLVALIPILNKNCLNKRTIGLLAVSVILSVIPALLWLKLVGYVGTNGGPSSDSSLQLQNIISNPLDFVAALMRTYGGFTQEGTWNKFYEVAFSNYVWDSVKFSHLYSTLAVVAVTISVGIHDKVRPVARVRMKSVLSNLVMIGSFLSTFVAINLAIYLYFSPVGSSLVIGVQARYIFPFLILILLPFQNALKEQRKAKISLISIILVCLIGSLVGIYEYIH